MTTFEQMNLALPILEALKNKGYTKPTEIQQKAIPVILSGRDLFGSAQTGTGKTAAFALPLLQLMSNKKTNYCAVRTLVLAPTRELAMQIGDSFRNYGKNLRLKHTVIYGGVSQHNQVNDIRKGVDTIIATPGRLLDLMNQGYVKLNTVEFLVLDEADRMLDMGFIHDIKRIISKVPQNRQTLFFSATHTYDIKKLATSLLRNPETLEVKHSVHNKAIVKESVYFVDKQNKKDLLFNLIKKDSIHHALVFTRTKRGADKLVKSLSQKGIRAQAIHGDKSQNTRQRALADFKSRKFSLLVATDVASRGIDVKELSHVINHDIPEQAEAYVHRIGRTGRAGANGIAISFCSPEEKWLLKNIHEYMGKNIPVNKYNFS